MLSEPRPFADALVTRLEAEVPSGFVNVPYVRLCNNVSRLRTGQIGTWFIGLDVLRPVTLTWTVPPSFSKSISWRDAIETHGDRSVEEIVWM